MKKIKINPKNKGKFNATKKATGKTTEELTHSKNPVTKKRAIFAQNAAKWKKDDGGMIDLEKSPTYYDFGLGEDNQLPPSTQSEDNLYFGQLDPTYLEGGDAFKKYQQNVNKPFTGGKIDQMLQNPALKQMPTEYDETFNQPSQLLQPKKFGAKYDYKQSNSQKPPTFDSFNINSFGGNKYFERANMYRNKAMDSFSNIKKHGGKIPKAEEGFNMNNVNSIVGGAANDLLANINTSKGFLDVFGNLKQNAQVNQWEQQQLKQSLWSDAQNQPPLANPFGKGIGENAAYFADGGLSKFKPYNQGGLANVEVENMETIQTPQGLIDDVHGATHEQGGIPMNLPENSKIFSEKLKHPFEKKSFAKLAKKFETKKDINNLESPVSDKINIATAELNIAMKNKLSDELFQEQESMKLDGTFGSKIKNETKKDYGFVKATGGKVDNKPTLRGTKKGVIEDYENLDEAYLDYKSKGYKGAKDVTQMREWDFQKNPTDTLMYIRGSQPTNKHLKIWKDQYSKTEPINLEYMTQDEVFSGYNDDLWDFRLNRPEGKKAMVNMKAKQPLVGDGAGLTNYNKLDATDNRRGFGNLNVNFQIPDTYPKDPIWTKQLSPQYIKPEKIVPYYNDIQRGNRAIQQNIGSRTGSDIGNIIQAQTTANEQIGKRIYDADVYNTGQSNNAQQFNAQSKMRTDQLNLDEFRRFTGDINKREATITGQRKIDDNANIQRMFDKDAYDQRRDYISSTFHPSQYNTSPDVLKYNTLQSIMSDPFIADEVIKKYGSQNELKSTTMKDKKYGGKIKFGKKKK